MNIPEIKDMLSQMLSEERFAHTVRVCETAVTLAERFCVDKEKAYLAALLHDCAREIDIEQQLEYCQEYNIQLDDHMKNDINPIHALIGADIAKRRFGVDDQEVLDAISRHAIDSEDMTLFDKIIFVADATEPVRAGKDADKARNAAENDLDKAILPSMRIKSYYLGKRPVHPHSVKMLKKMKTWRRFLIWYHLRKLRAL